jgi:hypothetical protein
MRSLNLDSSGLFVEVVTRGSFTAAAREHEPDAACGDASRCKSWSGGSTSLWWKESASARISRRLARADRARAHLCDEDARTRASMRRFSDKDGGRVRVGTSMTMLMYALPPILQTRKTAIRNWRSISRPAARGHAGRAESNTPSISVCVR